MTMRYWAEQALDYEIGKKCLNDRYGEDRSSRRKRGKMRRKLTDKENRIMKAFEDASLEPYVFCAAKSGSLYIKFKDSRLRSLRISNHKGYPKYSYKWNLIKNYKGPLVVEDCSITRYFYPFCKILDMIRHIKNYHNVVLRHEGPEKPKPKNVIYHEEWEDMNEDKDEYNPCDIDFGGYYDMDWGDL